MRVDAHSTSAPIVVLSLALSLGACAGCTGMMGEPASPQQGASANEQNATGSSGTGSSGTGSSGTGSPSGSAGGGGAGTLVRGAPGLLVKTKVRLLNNIEYNNTVAALLGDTSAPGNAFPPPAAQQGFTNNNGQVVGSLLGTALDSAAQTLAANAVKNLTKLLPCDPAKTGEQACATSFVDTFGARAFRRPLTREDRDGLLGIYTAARTHGGTFQVGIQMVLYGILSSGSFLYLSELGTDTTVGATTTLTPYEIASALSYFILASPPDAMLTAAAASNSLSTPEQLESQARRLLADPRSQVQVERFVKEWFEIKATTKDSSVYPQYQSISQSAMAETTALIRDVMVKGDGSLKSLLLADYTFVDKPLADYYGITQSIPAGQQARVSLDGTNRKGIMTQAAFLAAHGDQATSSPVKRGVFVRRRLLCQSLPSPPPGVDTTLSTASTGPRTTRQLFEQHSKNDACAGCHEMIDPIGNGFESFDGAGKYRTIDNTLPVDATGELTYTLDADGKFDGASELAQRLALSDEVNTCFNRQVFRFAMGEAGAAVEQQLVNELPAPAPSNYQDIVLAFVRTSMFGKRLVQ